MAGPEEKGKGSLVIEHTTGQKVDEESGSVEVFFEIDLSLPAAISHLEKHADDCVVSDPDKIVPANLRRLCDPIYD